MDLLEEYLMGLHEIHKFPVTRSHSGVHCYLWEDLFL